MIIAPCRDCQERKIPKTCEKTCQKWINFKKELEQEKEKINNEKYIQFLILSRKENSKRRLK